MTAPATIGPHEAPRPTSSTRAGRLKPSPRASSSKRVPQRSSTPWWTRGRLPRPFFFAFAAAIANHSPDRDEKSIKALSPLPRAVGRSGPPGSRVHPLLPDPARLALEAAQVVELGP